VTEDQARTAALKLMAELGIPCYPERSPRDGSQWDGVATAIKGSLPTVLFHDIAHWLLCPRRRRSIPDFGLGPSPDSKWSPSLMRKIPLRAAEREEELASVLGIALEARAGMKFGHTILDHNWADSTDARKFRYRVKALAKRFPQYMTTDIATELLNEYKRILEVS
jgi:elongation factor P hydroxylase